MPLYITNHGTSDDATTSDSTTLNVQPLHICYLCWRHAEHEYPTTPCFLNGVFYPSETRHLCRIHWQRVWEALLESLYNRVHMQSDEEGRVA